MKEKNKTGCGLCEAVKILSARLFSYAFLALISVSIMGRCVDSQAAAPKNVSIAVIPCLEGLPDADRSATLLVSTIVSYALDSFSGVSVIPDSIVRSGLEKGDVAKMWNRTHGDVAGVMSYLRADEIVVCRFDRAAAKTKSECALYKRSGDGATAEMFRTSDGPEAPYKKRTAVIREILKRSAIAFAEKDIKSLWAENNEADLRGFADGLLKIFDGRTAQGLASLEKIAASAPAFRDLQYFLGIYYAETQFDYQSSIKRLEAVTKKYPADAGAFFQLGFVYRLKGEYGKAVKSFEEATSLKPGNYEAHIHLAMIHYDSGDYESCVEQYRKALAIRSDAASVWYSLAGALVITGKLNDAMNAVKKAVALEPETFRKIARRDMELAPLRKLPEFEKLVSEEK